MSIFYKVFSSGLMIGCLACLAFVAGAQSAAAPGATTKVTVSGYVSDETSGERLIGATVFDQRSRKGTVTNTYGFYSLTLNADSLSLVCSYVGYQPKGYALVPDEDRVTLNFKLSENNTLREVVVSAERYERIEERAQMSRIDVPIEQIKRAPALLGEKDVLKALQLLPGVSGGGEGQSGIYVRGGGPDQNLILLDGVPVYNASHLFGFFSVFNTDAIKDVSLIKGGFPARYGGRLSSVIEINLKEGNDQSFHGEGSIGLVASRLTLEGPIVREKASFIVSARRTYIDILARPIIKSALAEEGSSGTLGYFFDDINAKVNYRLSDKDRLYLSFYTGRDKFYFDVTERWGDQYNRNNTSRFKNDLGWGNITSALRWNRVIGPRLFANTTLTYSRFNFRTGALGEDRYSGPPPTTSFFDINYLSGIEDWAAKVDFDFMPSPAHTVKFGASAIYHTFNPGRFRTSFKDEDSLKPTVFNIDQKQVIGGEYALYIEDDWKISDRLRVNAGLHGAGFSVSERTYFSLQPRLNARYMLPGAWALKGAFSTMQQNIHLLTNETIGLPFDLWLPSTALIKPQRSWQAAMGIAKTLGQDYEFSVEAYYKDMQNVITFRDGASLFQFSNWEGRIEQGRGEAYGAEFFVQKKTGRFTGWVGYTLSWTWRQFKEANLGNRYPYRYDRRHDFEIMGAYQVNDRISLSAAWVFATGNVVTLASSKILNGSFYEYQNVIPVAGERNNFRMRPYHRLDFSADFSKKKKRHTRTWSFGAYNAYSRANPFFLYLSEEYGQLPDGSYGRTGERLRQTSLFPVIPYFAYSFKF